jgi:hypothetical protein
MTGNAASLKETLFAQAMASLPPMAAKRRAMLGERLVAIARAVREELADPYERDRELEWWSPGEQRVLLARGYDGHEPSFDLRDEHDEVIVAWNGDLALALLNLGRRGRVEPNVMRDEVQAVFEEAEYGVLR